MNDTTQQILEQMAAGLIPDDIPDTAEYADTLRRLAEYFAAIQHFTIALSNGDLSQSLQGVTGPVAGGLKSLQANLRHLTWQTRQIAAGDFSQSVDFMGDFSSAFNTMVVNLSMTLGQLQQNNQELNLEIEARKRAEEEHAAADDALRENTIFFTTLLNSLPLPVFYKDNNCRYIGFNKAYEEFIGKTRDQLLGKSVFDIAPGELAEVYHAKDLELLRDQGTQVYESQVKGMHGVVHDVVFHKATFMDSGGRVLGLSGAILDITERKRAEEELAFKNAILSTQQETTIDGILVVDESNTIISYNRRFADMWGIPRALVDAGDDAPVLRFVATQVADEEGFLATVRYLYAHKEAKSREEILLKDGRLFDRYSAPMPGADGKYLGRIWYLRDITERKQMEDAQRESRQLLTDVFDFLPDATFVLDNDKRVIAWNRAIEEMTGISKAEMMGQGDYAYSVPFYGIPRPHLLDLLDIDDKELEAKYRYVERKGNRLHAEVYTPALYGGKGAWIWGFGAPLYNVKGERIGAIETIRDITEQKRLETMLNQQARTDQLTGVNNRGWFLELLDVEIERAHRYGRSLCVLMLDLDHFKSVNDTRGHAAGDEAIRTVVRMLQSAGLRQSDFLGRIGGEEFAVALPETGLQDAADAAERLRSRLAATPVSYGSENFSITVTIGVSEYRDGDSQETLLQRADLAMYQAKQTGRNRVCLVS